MSNKALRIWLLGGFGNVLFQILVSKVLSKKGKDFKFVKMLTEKNIITTSIKWSIHQPLYNQLLQQDQFLKISMINAVYINLIATLSKTLKLRLRKATFYSKSIQFKEAFSENIFGYFQDKYFLNTYKKEVLELGEELRDLYGEKTENIVVHYRKGDSGWAERNSEYYIKVRDLIRDEPSKVFVITDSPNDAEAFFLGLDHIEILSSKNAFDDFKILLSAKKLYCAPSTFSWWAAHALDKNAKVIVPKILNDLMGFYTNALNLTVINNLN